MHARGGALSSSSSHLQNFSLESITANDVAFILHDGSHRRCNLPSGAAGLGWKGHGSARNCEEEHQRSTVIDGPDDCPGQGA